MSKRALLPAILAICMLFSACSVANDYGLSLAVDGENEKNAIYFDDDRMVYTIGGIMMANIDGESIMLETALYDAKVTLSDILAAAEEDASDGDVDSAEYPDGSVEYFYDGFNMIVLNLYGVSDVYFVPSNLSYYDVIN